ncbi:glycerophosphodiester phosphodiesterase family protein [Enterovibrio norvegicus]|uniref:glycerophosphodiester phosphodiesterase family protein n=1 Tax=Enterovibrio norvegicus TaxID=188144 RepID=UPI00355079D9
MIIGHRGVAALAPENTLSGIRKAAECGLDWVEIDTQLSADGIPVIFHDDTVERCTDGNGKLETFNVSALKNLDAGSWFDKAHSDERIPTLEETLAFCLDEGVSINLEIKIYRDAQVAPLVEAVSAVLASSAFPAEKLLISSFSKNALMRCKAAIPQCRFGFIADKRNISDLDAFDDVGLYSVHVDHRMLTSELAKEIKSKGYILNIWTLNECEKADAFIGMGVDNIITDDPTLFNLK